MVCEVSAGFSRFRPDGLLDCIVFLLLYVL